MKKLITLSFILSFSLIGNAFAYLDPGTGSIILQAILGVVAATASYCAFYWSKVKNFFKNLFKKKENTK
jgi:O-antigen/teichoic acid export membrane protein